MSLVQTYKGKGVSRGKVSEAIQINYTSILLRLFLLYFFEIVALLVLVTNRYCHPYLDNIDERLGIHVLSREKLK
jgi:hypothetical protein